MQGKEFLVEQNALWNEALGSRSILTNLLPGVLESFEGGQAGCLISALAVDVGTVAHSDFYSSVPNDSPSTQSDARSI